MCTARVDPDLASAHAALDLVTPASSKILGSELPDRAHIVLAGAGTQVEECGFGREQGPLRPIEMREACRPRMPRLVASGIAG